MASRAKNKLQFTNVISQYYKQQNRQNGKTNNRRAKRTESPSANNLKIKLEEAEGMRKAEWKRKVKERIQEEIQRRAETEMESKTKMRTICKDKWERKAYINNCDSDIIKDIIKIRLNMWELLKNYPREAVDTTCPLCKEKEDTTEHVLECKTNNLNYRLTDNTTDQWTEIVKIFRQNKELRK